MFFKGFWQILIGFIFLLLNYTVRGFDIFSDLIGYILIAIGLALLAKHHRAFSVAFGVSIVLLFFSLDGVLRPWITGSKTDIPTYNGVSFFPGLIGFITLLIPIVFYILIGIGMVHLLNERNCKKAALNTAFCILFQVITFLVANILLFFRSPSADLSAPAFFIIEILTFAAGLWLVASVHINHIILRRFVIPGRISQQAG